jgi:hypothetical protein
MLQTGKGTFTVATPADAATVAAKCSDPSSHAHPRGICPPFSHPPIPTATSTPPAISLSSRLASSASPSLSRSLLARSPPPRVGGRDGARCVSRARAAAVAQIRRGEQGPGGEQLPSRRWRRSRGWASRAQIRRARRRRRRTRSRGRGRRRRIRGAGPLPRPPPRDRRCHPSPRRGAARSPHPQSPLGQPRPSTFACASSPRRPSPTRSLSVAFPLFLLSALPLLSSSSRRRP